MEFLFQILYENIHDAEMPSLSEAKKDMFAKQLLFNTSAYAQESSLFLQDIVFVYSRFTIIDCNFCAWYDMFFTFVQLKILLLCLSHLI